MSIFHQDYDVIVIGGGPAGAHAARRASVRKDVLLLTTSWDTVAWPARGPIVSLPAGGALLGHSGAPRMSVDIQTLRKHSIASTTINGKEFLNIDCLKYQEYWKHRLESTKRLTVFQDTAERVTVTEGGWRVETRWGTQFGARRVIVAVGTFLGGLVRVGDHVAPAGRPGELCAEGLEGSLRGLGVQLIAVNEAVPPTISAGTVDWIRLEQPDRAESPHRTRLADGRMIIVAPVNGAGQEFYPYVVEDDHGGAFEEEHAAPAVSESALRLVPGLEQVKVVAPGYNVAYLRLAPGQLSTSGEQTASPGLFFAGRLAGARDYIESIKGGLVAGGAKR